MCKTPPGGQYPGKEITMDTNYTQQLIDLMGEEWMASSDVQLTAVPEHSAEYWEGWEDGTDGIVCTNPYPVTSTAHADYAAGRRDGEQHYRDILALED